MQALTERFEMRLDQDTLREVDVWRSREPDMPSRSEAIRRLIERGLAGGGAELRFSEGETLILHMLADIMRTQKIRGEIDPKFVQAALFNGHLWGLKWEYSGVFDVESVPASVRKETVDILDMWTFIEIGFAALSRKEKDRVVAEAEPYPKDVKFIGFDGNNETDQLSVARFLIDEMGRFATFKGRELNSHMPSIDGYRSMLRVFEPMRKSLAGAKLSVDQTVDLLKARTA